MTKETDDWLAILANLCKSLNIIQTYPSDIRNALCDLVLAQTIFLSLQRTSQSFKFDFQSQYLSALVDFLSCIDFSLQENIPSHRVSRVVNDLHRLQNFFVELCYCHFGIDTSSRRVLSFFSFLVYLAKRSFAKKFNLKMFAVIHYLIFFI